MSNDIMQWLLIMLLICSVIGGFWRFLDGVQNIIVCAIEAYRYWRERRS